MGLFDRALKAVAPPKEHALAATVPTWQVGLPQTQPVSYEKLAREGYARNEIVFACVEQLATSVAEPRIVAYRKDGQGREPQKVENHPILDLLERPNPWMSRSLFWQTVMMHRAIAGNIFIEKVRSRARRPVELWTWRPDRVKIIPDPQTFIRGYQFSVGTEFYELPAQDIMHLKNRAPLDDYYGMPPIQAVVARVDTDNYMREFTRQFFVNAGVPSGLLNLKNKATPADRELIRARFRQDYAGPSGWHNLMVIDGTEVEYTPMGLALGERGLAMSDLDDISTSRIAMPFGVPLTLIAAKLGMASSSYANRAADLRMFWDQTLVPIYREFAAALTTGLVPEFDGVDYVEFDLGDVKALEEDRNEFHARVRSDFAAGLIARQQARDILGYAEPNPDDTYLVPATMVPEPVTPEPEPEPEPEPVTHAGTEALPPGTVSGVPQLAAGMPLPTDQSGEPVAKKPAAA